MNRRKRDLFYIQMPVYSIIRCNPVKIDTRNHLRKLNLNYIRSLGLKSPKSSVILVKFTFFPAISGKIFVLFCHVCDPSYDQVQTQKFLIAVQNVTNDSF